MADDAYLEALTRIADQLERLPGRTAKAMGKAPSFDYQDMMLRSLGIDPDKARERQKVAEEIRHLRQTRITSIIALVIAALSMLGTLAIAATQVL